jgi:mannitol-1-/sugar-/sorbitol-6-phosphatase
MTTAPSAPLRCRAVLFDLDGVLVDSTALVERLWRAFAVRHALDADALLRVVHGRRAVDTIPEILPGADVEAELARLVDEEVDGSDDLAAIAGAPELLRTLPVDRWAVVTSGTRQIAEARLRAASVRRPLCLVAADEIERGKPDPEGYLRAADALRVAPADCVVVEDAPAGIAAARAAGMRVVALTTTHDASAVADADLVVPTLAALDVRVDGDEIVIRRAAENG